MKLLLSVVSAEEAKNVLQLGPDLLDIKNPEEGSLGAQFPWVLKEIVEVCQNSGTLCSATLGDLQFKPGTASLAALGAASCNVQYIKAGMFGIKTKDEATKMMLAIRKSVREVNDKALVVASGYADYKRFNGISYMELVKASLEAGCDGVMVDTAIKDGKNLFDCMNLDEIKLFIDAAKNAGLFVALAGSIRGDHLETLNALDPDIIGIRGAVCEKGNREVGISPAKVEQFINQMKSLQKFVDV